MRAAELAAFEVHDIDSECMRQRFAAHLLEDGIDVPISQAQLGHATLETTACDTRVAYDLWLAERGCRIAVDRGSSAGTGRRFSIDQVK